MKNYEAMNYYSWRDLECTCYLNLLLMTIGTFYKHIISSTNTLQNLPVNISVSITLILATGVTVYHTHNALARIKRYKRLCGNMPAKLQWIRGCKSGEEGTQMTNEHPPVQCSTTEVALSDIRGDNSEDDQHRQEMDSSDKPLVVSVETNSLREPLLSEAF